MSLCAVGLNLLKIDIGFGVDLRLGSRLAVFALLVLGEIGLVMDSSRCLISWRAWGHP